MPFIKQNGDFYKELYLLVDLKGQIIDNGTDWRFFGKNGLFGKNIATIFPILSDFFEICLLFPQKTTHLKSQLDLEDLTGQLIHFRIGVQAEKDRLRFDFQTDQELKMYQADLQAVFDNSSFLQGFVDKDFRLLAFNKPSQQAVGKLFAQKPRIGHSIFDFLLPSFQTIFVGCFGNVLFLNESQKIAYQGEDLFGKTICYDMHFYSVQNSENKIEKIAFTCYETTQTHLAQQALQKSEANLSAVFNSSNLFFYLINKDLILEDFNLLANQLTQQVFGESLEAGHSILDYLLEEAKESFMKNFRKALKGEIISSEGIAHFNEKQTWFEFTHYPIYNSEKKIDRVVLCLQNITQRKIDQEALYLSEIQYRNIFEQAAAGIFQLDKYGTILRINKTFYDMLAQNTAFCTQQNIKNCIEKIYLPDIESFINGNKKEIKMECRFVRQDQTKIWTLLTLSRIVYSSERTEILGIVQNISNLKKVQENLTFKNNELDTYVYRVSHDLRGPVATIGGLLQILEMENNTDTIKPYLSMLDNRVKHLFNILDTLMAISHLKAYPISLVQVDVKNLLTAHIWTLRSHQNFQLIDFEIDINVNVLYTDSMVLDTIFRVLLENAVQYIRLQENKSWINVQISQNEHAYKIMVADNGQGIQTEAEDKVFNMFFRANEASKGLGLGLYKLKIALEKLNGEVELINHYQGGATFIVSLPKPNMP